MDKACVILGAGASFDVYNGSSPINRPEYKPPLAIDLFDIQNHPAYFDVLAQYPGAQVIASNLTTRIRNGELDVEKELRKYAEHSSVILRENFKHVPPYLRDLLHRCSHTYIQVPGSYLQLVTEMLAEHPHEVLFLTLNYDTLLEQALALFDPSITFNTMGDYVVGTRQAKVVKLHGSINWFITFKTDPVLGWNALARKLDIFNKRSENQVIIHDNVAEVQGTQIDHKWLYPLLTAPLAGKGLADMVCPKGHLDFAKAFLAECRKFLVIGTSGLDHDLLNLLDETIEPSPYPIYQIVGEPRERTEQALNNFEKGVNGFKYRRIDLGYIFHRGFRQYVASDMFRAFASFDSNAIS